jgi:UDP-glucose 4-epimerase
MMRILITGGAGSLGSNLTEHWLAAGHKICVLDNLVTGHRGSLPIGHPHLTFFEGSVTDDATVDGVFGEFAPTHVVHAAASYKNPDDWLTDARTNVEGTIRIVTAARIAGVRRFVNFHTALGYGRPERLPIPVDAPARPFTSYGISKQAGEQYVTLSGISYVSLRLANVTGPRLAIGPIPTFYTRLKAGKPCFCSRTIRDFVDMADFLGLMDLAIGDAAPTGIFNVSTGSGHTIREIFDIVVDHLGIELKEPVREVDPGPDDVPAVVLDPSKAIADFGWRPQHAFEDIIRRMLAWYDRHGVTAIYSHLKVPEALTEQQQRQAEKP